MHNTKQQSRVQETNISKFETFQYHQQLNVASDWCRTCLCVRPQIERTLFEDTVKTLNNYYAEAEKIGGQSYLEGCLACATAYLIFLCMETRYEKVRLHIYSDGWFMVRSHRPRGSSSQVLKKIAKYIQEQNEKIYAPRGLLITDPIERGMRVVSFVYDNLFSSCTIQARTNHKTGTDF